MRRLILWVLGAFLINGTVSVASLLSAAGYAAQKATATMALQSAKRELPKDTSKALESVIKAEGLFKELVKSREPDADAKSNLKAAKTKTTLARKELEAEKQDSNSDHLTKAAALVSEALERLGIKK